MVSSSAVKGGAAALKELYLAVKLAEEEGMENRNIPAILSASTHTHILIHSLTMVSMDRPAL